MFINEYVWVKIRSNTSNLVRKVATKSLHRLTMISFVVILLESLVATTEPVEGPPYPPVGGWGAHKCSGASCYV